MGVPRTRSYGYDGGESDKPLKHFTIRFSGNPFLGCLGSYLEVVVVGVDGRNVEAERAGNEGGRHGEE